MLLQAAPPSKESCFGIGMHAGAWPVSKAFGWLDHGLWKGRGIGGVCLESLMMVP